jgi:hypothetical protein
MKCTCQGLALRRRSIRQVGIITVLELLVRWWAPYSPKSVMENALENAWMNVVILMLMVLTKA